MKRGRGVPLHEEMMFIRNYVVLGIFTPLFCIHTISLGVLLEPGYSHLYHTMNEISRGLRERGLMLELF